MTHWTNLKGPGEELFNVLDDLLAYLWEKAKDGTPIPHENVTLIKARKAIKKYAANTEAPSILGRELAIKMGQAFARLDKRSRGEVV
jgi:hypothetical protein